ncbi:MAG: hypothetical protein ABIE22_03865 [archaeon]
MANESYDLVYKIVENFCKSQGFKDVNSGSLDPVEFRAEGKDPVFELGYIGGRKSEIQGAEVMIALNEGGIVFRGGKPVLDAAAVPIAFVSHLEKEFEREGGLEMGLNRVGADNGYHNRKIRIYYHVVPKVTK